MNHEAVMKNIMPVILAGVLGIYGLITAAILVQSIGASKVHTYFTCLWYLLILSMLFFHTLPV
jgi:hypothetical protein